MSENTLVVQLTVREFEAMIARVVDARLEVRDKDFKIDTLEQLCKVYDISMKKAMALRKDLIADGIAKSFGPKSWAVMKSECDRYLKSREVEEIEN